MTKLSHTKVILKPTWGYILERNHMSATSLTFFFKQTSVRNQKMIHTGEKLYQCIMHDKAFRVKSPLVVHKSTCPWEKPHQCGVCDKRIGQVWSLVGHNKMHNLSKNCLGNIKPALFNIHIKYGINNWYFRFKNYRSQAHYSVMLSSCVTMGSIQITDLLLIILLNM